ncbi:MAG TPA: spore coat U domain-containing protein [Steroidobacteraceae bacterium]|jgi:spore coat protein U-like protein|nr:spore coat U domain-containing protein [Steroidobacteraceae bacterium]
MHPLEPSRRSGRRSALALWGASLILAATQEAAAGSASTALLVSAVVDSTCAVSANPLTFPTYYPGNGGVNANTTLSVRCSRGAQFTVTMDAGTGGGTLVQRLMSSGAAKLQYNLYTSAARTTVWGDGTVTSAVMAGIGKGLAGNEAITETVFGTLPDSPANRQLAPGLYTDTVMITVAY